MAFNPTIYFDRDPGGDQRQLLLRAVTWKTPGEISPHRSFESVKSEDEMREFSSAVLNWCEADLKTCPKALEAFLALATVAVRDFGEPGDAGAWAKNMLALAEPCLRPTPAPAPWDSLHTKLGALAHEGARP
jgi:hypothetical protein